ncbi:MAG: hypothetical protein WKF37_02430 [Bryobacteraceae bacterium]
MKTLHHRPSREQHGGTMGLTFLVLAVVLQDRLFPFNRATVALFRGGPILIGALLVNSHLGAFLIARVAIPAFPELLPMRCRGWED